MYNYVHLISLYNAAVSTHTVMIQCITHAAILVVYIYSHAAKLSISPVASISEVNRYFINQAQ